MKTKEIIKGYKGFDKDLKCRGFQYKEGKTYETDKKPIRCTENGFHLCENPLDTWSYYPLNSRNQYHLVEGSGDVSQSENGDSKIAVQKIKINTAVSLFDMIRIGVDIILKKVKATTGCSAHAATTGDNAHAATTGYYAHAATTGCSAHAATTGNSAHAATTGDYAHAATTGYYAHAATTGYSAHAATTGYYAHAATTGNYAHAATTGYYAHAATTGNYAHAATTGYSAHAATTGDNAHAATTGNYAHAATTGYSAHAATTGDNAIAAGIGMNNKAKANLGSWIVLSEYDDNYILKCVKTVRVDGKKILPDTWYMLKNRQFIKSE